MALGDAYKTGRDMFTNIVMGLLKGTVAWIKGPVAWIIKRGLIWFLDKFSRPIYDLLERKVVTSPEKKDVKQKVEDLKKAKTEQEINQAIDNLP